MISLPDLNKFLKEREKIGIKLGLNNIKYLTEELNNPQKDYFIIHIAGTNGKGSVAAMLSSILHSAGIKAGLYTSPHLRNVKERIRVDERDITENELLRSADKVRSVALPETTYFEFITAVALESFRDKGVKIAILETGMGGRYDATNICKGNIVIITDIALEHTKYLGNSVEEIKAEKEAIIKENSVVIKAESLNSNYKIHSHDLNKQVMRIGKYDRIKLNLLGEHQIRNCALAIQAIEILQSKEYNISEESIYDGLSNIKWPGRFQVLSKEPLIIVDGAHNPFAAKVLRNTVESYLNKKVVLILGVLKDKDYKGIVKELMPIAERIIAITPKTERALSGEVLKKEIKGVPVEYIEDVNRAIKSVKENSPILTTGSLYLAGEVLG